jgi:hypothetical protein
MIVSHWPTTMIGPVDESQIVAHTLHSPFFIFVGRDETKQCTQYVLNIDRGLLLGSILDIGQV